MKLMTEASNVISLFKASATEDDANSPSSGYSRDDLHARYLLQQSSVMHHFPIRLESGTYIDRPNFYCRFCQQTLEPKGRIKKFARAVLIEAAADCPNCKDYTCFDARILDNGSLRILDYQDPGSDVYKGKIHASFDDDEQGDPPESWMF
ncbi:hypothetical protein [Thiomonas sp.]